MSIHWRMKTSWATSAWKESPVLADTCYKCRKQSEKEDAWLCALYAQRLRIDLLFWTMSLDKRMYL